MSFQIYYEDDETMEMKLYSYGRRKANLNINVAESKVMQVALWPTLMRILMEHSPFKK